MKVTEISISKAGLPLLDGEVIHKPIRVHIPPEPGAGEFWLRLAPSFG